VPDWRNSAVCYALNICTPAQEREREEIKKWQAMHTAAGKNRNHPRHLIANSWKYREHYFYSFLTVSWTKNCAFSSTYWKISLNEYASKHYYVVAIIYEYVLCLGRLETEICKNYAVYRLKKLWNVMEIMNENVTLTEYPNVIGKNVCIILDTCFKAVE